MIEPCSIAYLAIAKLVKILDDLEQSLGNQVYDVGCLYLYSDNEKQLTGVINYNIFDVNGNANITNVVTAVDPYQNVNSLLVKISDKVNSPIIFNGNSSVSTIVLANTFFQVKFLADRITNKLGLINSNFKQMEELVGSKFFEGTYSEGGDAMSCSGRDNLLTGQELRKTDIIQNPQVLNVLPSVKKMELDCNIFLLIASVSAGFYLFSKKD